MRKPLAVKLFDNKNNWITTYSLPVNRKFEDETDVEGYAKLVLSIHNSNATYKKAITYQVLFDKEDT